MSKGRAAMIEGELRLDQWNDKQTGEKRSKLKVVAEKVHFLDSAAKGGGQAAPANEPPPPEAPTEQPAAAPARPAAPARLAAPARPAQAAPARQVTRNAPGQPMTAQNLDIPDEEIPF